jgi:hypothetical protein
MNTEYIVQSARLSFQSSKEGAGGGAIQTRGKTLCYSRHSIILLRQFLYVFNTTLCYVSVTHTKRPVTKRPVTKRPVTKRPVTKGPDYHTSRLPNVQLPKVQITKRPVYQTSSYRTSSYRTSILVIITKHPFFILIISFNKMCQKYQVCIPF